MSELLKELIRRCYIEEEIDSVIPYDLTGIPVHELNQIYFIIERYSKNAERVAIAIEKRRTIK